MKITIAIALTFLGLTTQAHSQNNLTTNLNAVSFELGKTGLIFNLSYDHRFKDKNFGVRAVTGSNLSRNFSFFSIGGGGYYLVGKRNKYLELGVDIQQLIIDERSDDQRGVILVYPDYPTRTVYPSLNIGYRSYGRKTLFRVGLSPGILESRIFPGGYVGFGITF